MCGDVGVISKLSHQSASPTSCPAVAGLSWAAWFGSGLDSCNHVAEYTGTTRDEVYNWAMDLIGSTWGAGGVRGLLAVTQSTATYYLTEDGNGNVSENAQRLGGASQARIALRVSEVNQDQPDGSIAAQYEYDAFGNTIVSTGTEKDDFTHRCSTKSLDATTGWYYYGYRYYKPKTGRWPFKDPIAEF